MGDETKGVTLGEVLKSYFDEQDKVRRPCLCGHKPSSHVFGLACSYGINTEAECPCRQYNAKACDG